MDNEEAHEQEFWSTQLVYMPRHGTTFGKSGEKKVDWGVYKRMDAAIKAKGARTEY